AEDHGRAYALSSRAVALSVAARGEAHPLVADAKTDLGRAARSLGYLDEASRLGEQALQIRTRALGGAHPDLAYALDLLTEVRRLQGEMDQAKAMAERGRVLRATAYGDTHPLVARSLYARALAEEKLGQFDAALRSMARVSEIDEQLHPLNIDRLPTLREQARMAFSFGEGPKRGRVHLERAWEIVEQSEIPRDHPMVRDLNHGYGETLLELGLAAEGLPYLEAFVADPRPHAVLPHLKFVLVRALVATNTDPARARRLFEEAYAAWEDSEVPFHVSEIAQMNAWRHNLPSVPAAGYP
ncbi:MAG: tetratricopeptide repeat protein, partial [Myxococcota bacterium]